MKKDRAQRQVRIIFWKEQPRTNTQKLNYINSRYWQDTQSRSKIKKGKIFNQSRIKAQLITLEEEYSRVKNYFEAKRLVIEKN